MRLEEQEIAALFGAAFDAENDVFLVSDAPFRPAQAAALRAALGRNLIVFLPGDYYPFGLPPAQCFFREPHPSPTRTYRFPPAPFVCWADIRLAGDPAFAAALAQTQAAWILPAAECADEAQPGWRESYRYLAELRTGSRGCAGLAALFSVPPADYDFYTALLGSPAAVAVDGAPERGFPAVQTRTEADCAAFVLRECEQQRGKRTAVFFPTRRQAEAFGRALQNRGLKSAVVHGGRTHGENALSLARFLAGETEILCATGHALASAPFLSADRALCCGLPLSAAFAARCASLLPEEEELLIVYSPADIGLHGRIARSRAAALSLPEAEFLARRKALCEALLRQLRL